MWFQLLHPRPQSYYDTVSLTIRLSLASILKRQDGRRRRMGKATHEHGKDAASSRILGFLRLLSTMIVSFAGGEHRYYSAIHDGSRATRESHGRKQRETPAGRLLPLPGYAEHPPATARRARLRSPSGS